MLSRWGFPYLLDAVEKGVGNVPPDAILHS